VKGRRVDLYAECNVEPRAPVEQFTAECCSRCVNPECTRSTFGNSKFETRVDTWHERMFSQVPRMLPNDPRFGAIAGQKFRLIDPAAPSQPSSWMDPRDLDRPVQVAVPVQAPIAPPAQRFVSAPEPAPEPQEPAQSVQPVRSLDLPSANTPVQRGQMLGGKPAPSATPGSKEWKTAEPAPPAPANERLVKTGARVRLGS
jgi:hypothetical protein